MEKMMMDRTPYTCTRLDHIPEKPIIDSTCPTWKLYQNPFYNSHLPNRHNSISNKHLNYCLKLASSSFRQIMDSELEFERDLRMKFESLAKKLALELDEERKGREAMERLCQKLAKKISSDKAEIDRMKKEIEEERKMMRLAEILREERVQMKLADLKLLFEDKLLELEDNVRSQSEEKEVRISKLSESVAKFSRKMNQTRSEAVELPSMAVQRRASPEPENPHILRGIKGFVEFPRIVRSKGLKSRDSDAKLECQKAQMRVLLKQKGAVRSSNSLIIS